ncbi:hypothetical protein MOB80_12770 [Bacillus inaquosorum]|uniref:hypothetical protein n=1 Tax=Bacillus inaquosorum TaxID=483913 RepID=UPI00227F5C0E|nr:hypothetical protein [Bacillus inaquosorum]MCY8284875.1 hypothetical protein [Bacillus inaquosorum]MCY9380416.1 hypothetical protein [Bacillus inaquosorum]
MKKVVLPFAATVALVSSSMFSLPGSAGATSTNTDNEEWVTLDESMQSSGSILETATESPDADITKKDYTTTWTKKKLRAGKGFFQCKYSMRTQAKAKMRINKIEAKSRIYDINGSLTKSASDSNSNSDYAGVEAVGGVTGTMKGCKGSAYGNSKYERKGYKTVTHQKKYNISDLL